MIQVCGSGAWAVTRKHLQPLQGRVAGQEPRCGPRLMRWHDESEILDEVLVTVTPCGATSIVTIGAHGGVRIVQRMLLALRRSGVLIEDALPAEETWPGLSPIDQAVMGSLPHCQTPRVVGWLLEQAEALQAALRAVIGQLEHHEFGTANRHMQALLETYEPCRRAIMGAGVALVGLPNAGKSTIANRLFDQPWSLESPAAGTTRDWVERSVAIEGLPVRIADTAGLGAAASSLEGAAQEHNRPIIAAADLLVMVVDVCTEPTEQSIGDLALRIDRPSQVVVINKLDLLPQPAIAERLGAWRDALQRQETLRHAAIVPLSAKSGFGLDELRRAIVGGLQPAGKLPCPALWDARHAELLRTACQHLPESPAMASSLLRSLVAEAPR
jgi:small GTP-binding protein